MIFETDLSFEINAKHLSENIDLAITMYYSRFVIIKLIGLLKQQ